MGRDRQIELMISSYVLTEVTEVIQRKLPEFVEEIRLLLDTTNTQIVSEPRQDIVEAINELVKYPADAQVIAAAQINQVDYFVTLDKQHFLENQRLRSAVNFPIGTPGDDFLAWYRQKQVIDD